MKAKKLALIVGSIFFGGGVGMLAPFKGAFPAISLIIVGVLFQMYGIREEPPSADDLHKPE